jgi:uncharacterized protein YjlB
MLARVRAADWSRADPYRSSAFVYHERDARAWETIALKEARRMRDCGGSVGAPLFVG